MVIGLIAQFSNKSSALLAVNALRRRIDLHDSRLSLQPVANGDTKQLDAAKVKVLHEENPNQLAKHETFQDLVWAFNRRVDIVLQPKDTLSAQ